MKRTILIICCILCLTISLNACQQNPEPTTAATVPETIPATAPPAPVTEPPETEPPVTTEPDLSLDAEPGSYLMRYEDEITSDFMDYYLFIPENAEINMPIIIFLHGDCEVGRPEVLENYGIRVKVKEFYGDEFPFIGLSPCTHVPDWTNKTVTETLYNLINYIVRTYQVDPDRIILTGHSTGAIAVWHMISTYGDFFAGAVPVSCGTDKRIDLEMCAKVPILGIVGNTSTLEYNFYKAMVKLTGQINEAGGSAELMVLDGMTHEDTSRASFTQEAFDWMLKQDKGESE